MRSFYWHLAANIILTLSCVLAAAADPATTKVGVILPLSGPMADWGRSIQLGVEFEAKRNRSKIHYIFEDEGACDTKKAVTAAQKLLSIDKISLLITGCLNGTGAILPLAKKTGTLMVSAGLVDEKLAIENRDTLITPSASIEAEADGISKLLKRDGKKKLAIVRVEDTFTEALANGIKKYSIRDGWEVISEEHVSFDNTDFRSVLLKISHSGADSILVYTSTEQVVFALKQLKELKLDSLATYGGYVIEADPPPANDLKVLNGIRFVAALTPVNDELSRFLAENGSKETFQTRVAADAVSDIERAAGACEGKSPLLPCLYKSITARTVSSPAFSGAFTYDENGLASRTVRAKVVQDGEYRWIEDK